VKAAADRTVPASAEAVSEILARCDRSGEKVTIAGGGTLAGMGYPPERVDVTLRTTGLTGMVANERADLVIAARAGTPLQDVATLLGAQSTVHLWRHGLAFAGATIEEVVELATALEAEAL